MGFSFLGNDDFRCEPRIVYVGVIVGMGAGCGRLDLWFELGFYRYFVG